MRLTLALLAGAAVALGAPAVQAMPFAMGSPYAAFATPLLLGAGNSLTTTVTIASTAGVAPAGSVLIVIVASQGNNAHPGTVTALTDTNSDTFTPLARLNATVNDTEQAFYCHLVGTLAAGSSITATVDNNAGVSRGSMIIALDEISVSANDTNPAGTSGSGTAPSTATGALATQPELVVGYTYAQFGSGDTFTEASGFTALTSSTSNTDILRVAYKLVTTTASVTYAPTLGTSRSYTAWVGSFK